MTREELSAVQMPPSYRTRRGSPATFPQDMSAFAWWGKVITEVQRAHHKCLIDLGSFGMAILYRRKDDDSLVILKEINLHELNGIERQLALNEVALLSR